MNLVKEHDQVYKEYLNFINETIKDVKSIRRTKKFILKKEDVATEKEISQIEGDSSVAEEIEESEIKQKRASSKIYNFSNGDVYIGKMVDGNMDGTGIYTFSTEEGTMEYVGDFKDDMKHGKGIFTFSNGNSYAGGFENDLMNGIGKMIYSSKDEYIGNWKDGQKNGVGIYIWEEGSVYVGEFRNSKMEGYGTCYNKEGKIIYEGEWKNNLVHGKGTYTWQEGKIYTGDFLHGKKHGTGTFYLNNELVYDGTWKFDKPSICNRSLDELFSSKF
ncbi:hypothetical protein CHL78_001760 [Romboutsia weinsteinii]|uniref:MORN motif-containing protein n=1 Tax=Romboutsia weinsteinii TaxID=2020949 RepID=A0A371J9R6_9FIRM|nr:hypothetical protein [Romboutsia weinsteinii]RDY29453.1 hypothetical protein CHL78_001760 [Romboutsia weinsteinii]